jgi:hypothetical protein
LQVEMRQSIATGNDLCRAGEAGHKLLQRSFDLQNHACTASGDERYIAAELDRIAKSLLAMQQDGLAINRIAAEPKRLREIALGQR